MKHTPIAAIAAVVLFTTVSVRALDGENFNEAFTMGPGGPSKDYIVQQIGCTIGGNTLFPKDEATFEFQIINKTDQPIKAAGKAELMSYHTSQMPDNPFARRLLRGETFGSTPISVELSPKGFARVSVKPSVPETFGAYMIVIEIEGHGKQLGAPLVRVPEPVANGRVQFPAFALDINGWNNYPETFDLFRRVGIKAIRQEFGFDPSPNSKKRMEEIMKGLWDHEITLMITSAAGGPQPLDRHRKFLNDKDEVMNDFPLQDMCPLPSADEDFQKWIEYIAGSYGWPKGVVNAIELWNEPWEGCSISGWGADMLRYRDLYTRMALGIEDARKKENVKVLIGGCCSSMNTEDKLFCDGKDTFLKWLDFTSIHYQPMGAFPALIPEWVQRKSDYGPTRIWDTESWIGNSEEHISAVLAVMRAQGQSRTAGVLHDFTYGVTPTEVLQADGSKKKIVVAVPYANAAAIAANQKLVGERLFKEIVIKNGLPWIFQFDGLPNNGTANPDDGTLVVVGDIGGNTERERCLLRTVMGLKQVEHVQELKAKLAALPAAAASGDRDKLKRELIAAHWLDGATMTVADEKGLFRAYDYYGNPIAAKDGKIAIPLNISGYFLRTDGSTGSFQKLLAAVKAAEIGGYQPVEIVAHDMMARIENKPDVRVQLTNVLNRPLSGTLTVTLGNISLDGASQTVQLAANERREIVLKVTNGKAAAANTYPLSVLFDAGKDGKAELKEDLHVNLIARKKISVDGNLKDWKNALPQTVSADAAVEKNMTEKAWQPWEKFDAGIANGLTTAYLSCDDQYFYFAAKISDNSPYDGGVRFATRDDDQYFYPEKSYEVQKEGSGKVTGRREFVWPAGVRRFTYRKNPDLPSGAGTDNVQIAFGISEPGTNGTLAYPPGTMTGFMTYQCTDYEYAFNNVAENFGGGTEIWRLSAPGVPRKHFYPRQPKADVDGGPVETGKLVMKREENTRIVEAAIPWTEIPNVKKKLDSGGNIRFTFRVNDNKGPAYEYAANRSASKVNSYCMHNFWEQHWSNEIEFALDKK
jgi:hypothetical protein